MNILGIDMGSRSVKIAMFDESKMIFSKIIDTSEFYMDYCINSNNKVSVDFERLGITTYDKMVCTGYGRNNLNISDAEIIVELKAHAIGAVWQTGFQNFTLLDIGGQDSKVISIKDGKMVDMLLNDKCAASCGRYLENMSAIIGIRLREMEKYFENPVELNSTCAVFGESELIGRISEGYTKEQLAAGVNLSLFKRIKPMIERFPGELLIITGGVADNDALVNFIRHDLNFKQVIKPKNPQLNGAIGCCIFGLQKINKNF